MRRSQHERVCQHFNFCCGYCGVPEDQAGAELTVDHFQPSSRDGSDELENLVYACHACNEFKSDFWPAANQTRFLHPQSDDLTLHLRTLDDGTLEGLTPEGILWITRLRLNRPQALARRRDALIRRAQDAEFAEFAERLAAAERRIQRLTDETGLL